MATALEKQREEEYKGLEDDFVFIVENTTSNIDGKVISHFNSIKEVIHKVKLDLMTNCVRSADGTFDNPLIQISVRRCNKK